MTFGVIPKHLKIENPKRRLEALKREADYFKKRGMLVPRGLVRRIIELEGKA
jgi:hypothetical protein